MVNICKEFDKTIVVSENTLELLDKEIPTTFSGQIRSKNSQNKIKLFNPQSEVLTYLALVLKDGFLKTYINYSDFKNDKRELIKRHFLVA